MAPEDVYEQLRALFVETQAEVLAPGLEGYSEAIKRWSDSCEKRATAVVRVMNADDVTHILNFVQKTQVPFAVRGGGHSTSGASACENGVVIDLSRMRKVTVDIASKTIVVQGGCIWEDVDVEAAKYGLATVGGTVNHTGVGGLTLGGGYGWLSGRYGLTIDVLLSAKVVLADGRQVTASKSENSDLFWALRGAGQSFGVVTEFVFQAFDQKEPVYAGIMVFPPDKLEEVVAFANHFHDTHVSDAGFIFGFSHAPPPGSGPVVLSAVFYNGPTAKGEEFFAPLISANPLVNTATTIPYQRLNSILNDGASFGGRKVSGGGNISFPLDKSFIQEAFNDFVDFTTTHERTGESLILFEIIPYDKIQEVRNDATAFANRGPYYNVASMMKWYDANLDTDVRKFARHFVKKISKGAGAKLGRKVGVGSDGVGQYANYSQSVTPVELFGGNANRLLELKHKYDPSNLFNRAYRLAPAPEADSS